MFIGSPPAMPLLQTGKLKATAVITSARMPALPAVPTVAQSGLPGFESIAARVIFAPSGTPLEIIAKLNTDVARIIQLPEPIIKYGESIGRAVQPIGCGEHVHVHNHENARAR